jgi:hypothetical protein
MANRIERLLGYQLVKKAGMGNDMVHHIAQILQRKNPRTLEMLHLVETDHVNKKLIERDATIDDIKRLSEGSAKIIDLEVDTRLNGFLAAFPDSKLVSKGLQLFKVESSEIDTDRAEIPPKAVVARNACSLSNSFTDLRTVGQQLETYNGMVSLRVQPEAPWLPLEDQRVTTYQDLLNAMAFALKGIRNNSGLPMAGGYEQRLNKTWHHIEAGMWCWEYTPRTPETLGFKAVMDYVEDNMHDIQSEFEAFQLGEYIDSHVAQLPSLRRWWNY